MRVKDEMKQEALIEATIKVVNEIGFASSSVSKIAREAGISPATIYIYYENKQDLLVSTYVEIKKGLGRALLSEFDDTLPIREILKRVWMRSFDYISRNRDHFSFAEQFSNSPYSDLVNKAEMEKFYEPVIRVLNRGVEQKIIKDVSLELLSAFMFYPVMTLSNHRHCSSFELNRENIDRAFDMAWDAIKV